MEHNVHKAISSIRRKAAGASLLAFAQTYLKEYLKFKPSKAHEELYKLADDLFVKRSRKVVIAAPRGFGKTTMFGTILMLYSICFSKEKFIVICSNTSSLAEDKIEDIRKVFMENELIRTDFPELFDKRGKMPSWSKEEIVTANGIKVEVFGYLQKMRGKKHGAERPSLILVDDLDSEVNAGSSEQKNKLREWFFSALLKLGDEKTNFIMVGNFFHRFSVIGDLCSDNKELDWEKKVYKAIESFPNRMDLWTDCWRICVNAEEYQGIRGEEAARNFFKDNNVEMIRDVKLLWPERYDLFTLMMNFHNNPESFNAEMQNQPRESSSLAFDPSKFTYWNQTYKSLAELNSYLQAGGVFYAACDPSTGKKGMLGDNSAIVIIGVKDKMTYVLKADIRKRNMAELIDDILAYEKQYLFRYFGIEVNGGQEYFYQALNEKAGIRGVKINFKEIINSGDKRSRIETLSSDLRTGSIQLCQEHVQLIEEFSNFPFGKHDDGLDALEMVYRLYLENSSHAMEQTFTTLKIINQPRLPKPVTIDDMLNDALKGKFCPGTRFYL